MVQAIVLIAVVLVLFTVGYLGYGRYLARFVDLDDERETPAHKYEDGQEYVPASKPVLLGHHYSSIAGGAPIVGPITAAIWWGWLPALLWIAVGNPLFGAVHDFMSLTASVRHEGKSIGYIIGQYVGERGKNLLLWFAFLTIVLIVAVFALVIALVFTAYPQSATASMIYIALALVFGVYLYQMNLPFLPGAAAFIAAVFAGVWVGVSYPIALTPGAGAFGPYPAGTIVLFGSSPFPPVLESGNISLWIPIILLYGFVASVLPVWVLLQPRDFLTSSLLYTGVGGTLLAVVVGTALGATETLRISLPAYKGFFGDPSLDTAPLFPILFVTIACGSISGFHSLVSSGTTAKQLDEESDARTIGYGGMLAEGLLATVALVTVSVYARIPADSGIELALPNFATGGGIILNAAFGVDRSFAAAFMGLVLVSFLATSTDTAVRLGSYLLEEIVGVPETRTQEYASNRYVNSAVQVLPAYALVASGSWSDLWPLFGGANQTLAALALLTATLWLANEDERKQLLSTGGPMAAMLVVTVLALLYLAFYQNIYEKFVLGNWGGGSTLLEVVAAGLQIAIALVLVALAVRIFLLGYRNMRGSVEQGILADGSRASDADEGSPSARSDDEE